MKTILSLQSYVTYGYVGNRVASFILQRLGFDVIVLNTVQFSNHTGYGAWSGDVFSKDHLEGIIDHLHNTGRLEETQALLTGYLGDPQTADLALKVRNLIPETSMYVCDPVMGDVGRGFFVREGILEKFQKDVVPRACIITPNLFELEALSQITIQNLEDLKKAVTMLERKMTLVTSVDLPEVSPEKIAMVLSFGGEFYMISTPRFQVNIPPNGAGDAVSAFFLGFLQQGDEPLRAFQKTATAMHYLFEKTFAWKERELALIHAQDKWSKGEILFNAMRI